jgi:hypothetical protein
MAERLMICTFSMFGRILDASDVSSMQVIGVRPSYTVSNPTGAPKPGPGFEFTWPSFDSPIIGMVFLKIRLH